ncbi:hypothetical protein NN561_014259 [Cricetulus griseus]
MHRTGCGSPGAGLPTSGIPRGEKWERLARLGSAPTRLAPELPATVRTGRRTEPVSAQAASEPGSKGRAPWRARDQVIAAPHGPQARTPQRWAAPGAVLSDRGYPADAGPLARSRAAHPGRGRK